MRIRWRIALVTLGWFIALPDIRTLLLRKSELTSLIPVLSCTLLKTQMKYYYTARLYSEVKCLHVQGYKRGFCCALLYSDTPTRILWGIRLCYDTCPTFIPLSSPSLPAIQRITPIPLRSPNVGIDGLIRPGRPLNLLWSWKNAIVPWLVETISRCNDDIPLQREHNI